MVSTVLWLLTEWCCIRSERSSPVGASDETAEVEPITAAGVTKPDDVIQRSLPVTSDLHHSPLMPVDIDSQQSTLGWFFIVHFAAV